MTQDFPIVEIYTKDNCHLCDVAKNVIKGVSKYINFEYKEIDITQTEELNEKYKYDIPVIFINGVIAFKYRLTEAELIKSLKVEKILNSLMKIGIDTRFYSSVHTGIGKYTYELCKNLIKYNDLELFLVLNKDSPILEDDTFKNTHKVLVKSKIFSIGELITLGKKIDDLDLDLYHSPSIIMPFVNETKTIFTFHDLIHIRFPQDYSLFHLLYYKLIVKRAMNNAEKVITVSNYSKKDIENWSGKDNIKVIYNGVNENFQPCLGVSDIFYNNNIKPSNYILYVGNNKPHKNLILLVKAYYEIINEIDYFPKLVLICKPDNELKTFIEDNILIENVIFISKISEEELILLYSYALYFILPSLYEGFGLPVLEAMSCGCPVTCSNITAIPEVANNAALYFTPHNINSIIHAMKQMFFSEDLRNDLSLKGLENVKKFRWERTAQETYNLYNDILSK